MKKIVIFASGSGSNAEKIIVRFKESDLIQVATVFTNNANAKVIDKAKSNGVDFVVFNKEELYNGFVLDKLNQTQPDLIVLAGFLLQFPSSVIEQFPNKIINIHPALLPKYGGKGMYGIKIHQTIFDNKEVESGITIHFVNEHYDEGEFIFQEKVNIKNCENPQEIADKVLELEHHHFPITIEKLLTESC